MGDRIAVKQFPLSNYVNTTYSNVQDCIVVLEMLQDSMGLHIRIDLVHHCHLVQRIS